MFFLHQNFTYLFCVRFPKASTVLSMCRSTPKVFHRMMSSTFTSWRCCAVFQKNTYGQSEFLAVFDALLV
jgi:hypothetical protein